MSSLLPLGDTHADQTNRLRRHHAAEAAQGALTMLRAHCLPANVDTDQVHGPARLPDWMRPDFTVRRVSSGFLLMDGETPVSRHPFTSLTSANSVMRDCQSDREVCRVRYLRSVA